MSLSVTVSQLRRELAAVEADRDQWRDRALRAEQASNVIPMHQPRKLEPVAEDAQAISRLNIPTYDPSRNMILDPFEAPKPEE